MLAHLRDKLHWPGHYPTRTIKEEKERKPLEGKGWCAVRGKLYEEKFPFRGGQAASGRWGGLARSPGEEGAGGNGLLWAVCSGTVAGFVELLSTV